MKRKIVRSSRLEQVLPESHRFHDVLFYDPGEGKYYDKNKDLYLELEDLLAYGVNRSAFGI